MVQIIKPLIDYRFRIFQVGILLFYCYNFYCGLQLTPDSFAYLDGAKNLISSGEYKYDCNNQPITLFPPLYSFYLAGFMLIGGFSSNLVIASSVISFLFVLIYLNFKVKKINNNLPDTAFLFLLCHFYFVYMGSVLSEVLFIPIFLIWIVNLFKQATVKKNNYFILFLEILMVSTRYSGVLLIAAYYLSVFINDFISERYKLKYIKYYFKYLFPLVTLIYFIRLRSSVGGNGSVHHFILGSGKYSVFEYFIQIVNDIGYFFIGAALAFQLGKTFLLVLITLVLLFLFFKFFTFVINFDYILFLVIAILIHILFLANVWVDDTLQGRYMFWLYPIILMFSIIRFRDIKYSSIYICFILLLLFVSDAYFIMKKHNKVANESENHYYLRPNIYFQSESISSTQEFLQKISNHNDSSFLISPCYKWNLINK